MTTHTQPGTAIERSAAGPTARPRVVIVGAGFGGLEAAPRALSRRPVEHHRHRRQQPPLHSAAAVPGGDGVAVARRHRVADPRAVPPPAECPRHARHGDGDRPRRARGPQRRRRPRLRLPDPRHRRDALFTSAIRNGRPTPGLKRIEDATRIRRRILLALERAEISDDERERRRLMTFVIVGGGPDRRGDGRRHRGDRDAHAEIGFPQHRSAPLAYPADRGRPAHPARVPGGAVRLRAQGAGESRRRDPGRGAGDALRRAGAWRWARSGSKPPP